MRRYSLQGQPCSSTFGGRANALWGGGGKRSALLVALLASLLAAIAGSVSGAAAATTSAYVTGKQILKLAGKSGVQAIVPDAKLTLTAYSNNQIWPQSAGTTTYGWATPPSGTTFPTIAIVDSGVSSRAAFGSRLVGSVDL